MTSVTNYEKNILFSEINKDNGVKAWKYYGIICPVIQNTWSRDNFPQNISPTVSLLFYRLNVAWIPFKM